MERAREEPVLNVDPLVQVRLLDVQGLDTELDRIRHRRANLAETVRVRELATAQRILADRITAVETEIADLELEQRKADADVDVVRQRAVKDRHLLDSGVINDAKQLSSLQHELESLARRQGELEEIELEIMERVEAAEHRRRDLMAERVQLESDLSQATSAEAEAIDSLAAAETDLTADRAVAVADIPADLLGLYERIRADHGGVGAAPLFRGRCEGCRIELTPVDIGRIRSAPAEEVLRCEECRRILVRTAESGL